MIFSRKENPMESEEKSYSYKEEKITYTIKKS